VLLLHSQLVNNICLFPLDDMKRGRRHSAHQFAGQEEGARLAKWLNNEESGRIGAAVSKIKAEARTRKRIAHLVQDLNKSAEIYIHEGRADAELAEHIDRELSRYALRVNTFQVLHESKYKTFAEPKWLFGWYSNAGNGVAEMIFTIVRLGERGLLGRVRTCGRCERWFYAKFNHQRFCGKKCQLLHYQTSEEWKARRRERYHERNS
jgi:hypothetical protein